MDNLCHTLAGAALGEASLKRHTRLGMATLMLASNLPDVDVAVFATDTLAMSFRRVWTHGVLAQALLPPVLALVMFGWGRWRRPVRGAADRDPGAAGPPLSLRGLLLLAYVGTWLHVGMDWMNSYGVRLLKPFSDRVEKRIDDIQCVAVEPAIRVVDERTARVEIGESLAPLHGLTESRGVLE